MVLKMDSECDTEYDSSLHDLPLELKFQCWYWYQNYWFCIYFTYQIDTDIYSIKHHWDGELILGWGVP